MGPLFLHKMMKFTSTLVAFVALANASGSGDQTEDDICPKSVKIEELMKDEQLKNTKKFFSDLVENHKCTEATWTSKDHTEPAKEGEKEKTYKVCQLVLTCKDGKKTVKMIQEVKTAEYPDNKLASDGTNYKLK